MKILHCCLANFYIDNYGYQENVFPKMHKLQGHDVAIVASTETYVGNSSLAYVPTGKYVNSDGIPVERIPYSRLLPARLARKLRIYEGLSSVLRGFQPEIIFIHDCQFLSISVIARYAEKNPNVVVFVDSHTDFINSGRTWLSKNILHRCVYRRCAKIIEPYTTKFYGTLPLRVEFYRDVYGIAPEKLELLVMGADQTLIDLQEREQIRKAMRKHLRVSEEDFLFITGGKIDRLKGIHHVLEVFSKLSQKNVKLILFGTPDKEMAPVVAAYEQSSNVVMLGWLPSEEISRYLLASDCAIFAGTHSVLWEQAVGLGLPCVFKKWRGIDHVDLGGNCIFIDGDDEREISEAILKILDSEKFFGSMKAVAMEKGITEFSYFEIAKRAICVSR